MKTSLSIAVAALAALLTLPQAQAQIGGLGGLLGGGKSADSAKKSDPQSVEKDLKTIIAATSKSVAGLLGALGMKEESDKMTKNAECMEKSECGVKDGVEALSGASDAAKKEIESKKASGTKLDAAASGRAMESMLPGIIAMPLWKRVIDGGKALDKMSLLSSAGAGLARALPLVPGAAKGSGDFFKTSIDYLTFSGADTSSLQAKLNEGMTGL